MAQNLQVILPDLQLGAIPIRASIWHLAAGDWIGCGDRLLEVTAGDVLVDIPSPFEGVLRRRLVAEDEILVCGQVIAEITAED